MDWTTTVSGRPVVARQTIDINTTGDVTRWTDREVLLYPAAHGTGFEHLSSALEAASELSAGRRGGIAVRQGTNGWNLFHVRTGTTTFEQAAGRSHQLPTVQRSGNLPFHAGHLRMSGEAPAPLVHDPQLFGIVDGDRYLVAAGALGEPRRHLAEWPWSPLGDAIAAAAALEG